MSRPRTSAAPPALVEALLPGLQALEGKQVQVDDIRPAYAAAKVIEKLWRVTRTKRGLARKRQP